MRGLSVGIVKFAWRSWTQFYPLIYLKQPLQLLNYELETLFYKTKQFWDKYVTFVHTNACKCRFWWVDFTSNGFQVQSRWSKNFPGRSSWAKGRVGLSPLVWKKAWRISLGYLLGVLYMGSQDLTFWNLWTPGTVFYRKKTKNQDRVKRNVHFFEQSKKAGGKGSLKGIWFSSSFISGVDVGFVRFREQLSSFDGYLEAER